MTFEPGVSAALLTGSLMSCLATAAVLVSFIVYRKEQRTFRHVLILNLTLSEFINSLNNSISGIIYIRDKQLLPGDACTINGFVGQLSVQAADFSIFAIAIVTVLTVTRRVYLPAAPTAKKVLFALSIWVVPLFTSTFATVEGAMEPVAGNWCWISATRPELRYALTHGWRFLVIFGTIGIYAYTWWYMNHHFHTSVQADRTGFSELSGGTATTASSSTSSTGNTTRTTDTDASTLVGSPISVRNTMSWKTPGMKETGNAKAASNDDKRDALLDSARAKETFVDGGRPQISMITLQKPPPARRSVRNSGHGFGLSYVHEENRNLLSPPKIADHIKEDTDDEELLPPPPRTTRKSIISWQLPSLPHSPRGPWRHHFREFGVGQGSPAGSPLTTRPISIWPSVFLPLQSPRRADAPSRLEQQQPRNMKSQQVTLMTNASEFPMRRETRRVEREIKRMMLLNAYPVFYVLLSIPGLVNRLMEAITGVKLSSTTAQAMQASTQFIGLANALTYGFNRHVRHRIKGDWRMLRGRQP